jgi:spore coat polysaccharide biosynthesis predicted glycosyltransferase SpsG
VAFELERLGVAVELLTPDPDGARAAKDAGVPVAIADRLLAAAARGAGLAIVDSYRAGAFEVEELRRAGLYVAAFDDTADHVLPGDVVINGAPGAEEAPYDRRAGRRYLLGAAYFPLRRAFQAPPPRTIRDHVETVVVTLGGEDVHGLLGPCMRMAAGRHERARIIGIAGSPRDLEAPGLSVRQERCEVRHAPPDYADLVRAADVIVCGGGQTLVEAAAAGTPAVAIVLGDDQRPQRAAVIAAGAALDGGDWRLPPGERDARLRHALDLLGPADARARLSECGSALVDGRGAQRLAEGILQAWQEA